MIVVVGLPVYVSLADGEGGAGGLAVDVARAAVGRGRSVQLVGKIGDDGAGDAVVVALGRLGIGHSALLRDPVRPTPVLAAIEAPAEAGSGIDTAALAADEAGEEAPAGAKVLPEDPAGRPGLDAGDVSLALSYVAGAGVVVLAEPLPEGALSALVDGAAFSGAALVALVPAGTALPPLPAGATALEAPAVDDGSFARLVGEYAAGLDAGADPAAAFEAAIAASGWEVAEG